MIGRRILITMERIPVTFVAAVAALIAAEVATGTSSLANSEPTISPS